MLPTPDTSHVSFERVYEPAEDSFLLLDTLSSGPETEFLTGRFRDAPPPLVVEIGPGSGVVIGFVNAHASRIFGRRDVLAAAVDVNGYACRATGETSRRAAAAATEEAELGSSSSPSSSAATSGTFLDAFQGDLAAPLRTGAVDVLVFNPPYVPTEELPRQPTASDRVVCATATTTTTGGGREGPSFEDDSYLLSLSYAGGRDGMETTDRLIDGLAGILSPHGCAYVLLCAQNRPEEVKKRIRDFGQEWRIETVGSSGRKAGWEKLQIIRIWRE